MNVKRGIVVGSRGSRLALIQAESVVTRIRELYPQLEITTSKIVTRGDRNRHTRFDDIGEAGVFVKELEEALLEGKIDMAVHSLKDVPTQVPSGLRLTAVTERLDPRDTLVSRGQRLSELSVGAKIGTGSLRRAAQLAAYRNDLTVCSIRGNVDTRLRKVANGELDGVVLAAAALKRLGCEDRITEYFPPDRFLPAVGQGALVIETRLGDEMIADIVAPLNHLPTWQSISAERAFLSALGGGCRAPIAALGTVNGALLSLEGMVADVGQRKILRSLEEDSATAPEEIGVRLARKLIDLGAERLIAEAREDENR